MGNMVDNFDVECPENGYVKYGGERWCGIWWITLKWNAPENGDVECGGERLMWNIVGNGDVEYGG